ncbi:APC family permease [Fulvivirga sediminis]|uniref:Amino acid permease n=1 Tax=Fulvivirga sediminis TaxID=2803949 RepID=A0A937F8A4_9BACT|nr:APC family permease [Fulvivirga sediminis]MBL3658161.1 amino acid permease [Fulvivirga sediminis]
MSNSSKGGNLGFASVWSLTVGGMVGGGIYTALGVVVAVAMQWSWLSFAIAGVIAITSAYSYVKLANKFEESGGAFEYLRDINLNGVAGSLSWLLVIGYVLTIALYAFAFGHYVTFAFNAGPWLTRVLAIGIVALMIFLNLMGAGKLAIVEIIIVWANLIALLILAIYGLTQWDSLQLMAGAEPKSAWSAPIGAAAIFVSYEGFQLLTYEYDEIKDPKKKLFPAVISGVAFVILIYIIVALGAVILAGALTTIDEKQVALAVAAKEGLGKPGFIMIIIAAGLATSAAINSTLFSTAKLTARVAEDGEMPSFFDHKNSNDVPDRSVIVIGILAALLAILGSLSTLVEAASLIFLFTFLSVNYIAVKKLNKNRWIPITGMIVGGIVLIILTARLAIINPLSLALLAGLGAIIIFGRPAILAKINNSKNNEKK